jgi:predicted RNA-binding Zn-ribbon protein involved in translation (DUF1610 family)
VIKMDFECPLCNSLISVNETCPKCGTDMQDCGRVEDYFDPYNPYLEKETAAMNGSLNICVHLFSCPECGHDTRIVVNQVIG